MKILKSEFDKIRLEIDQLAVTGFWLETYALGLKERCRQLKSYMDALENLRPERELENDKRVEVKA